MDRPRAFADENRCWRVRLRDVNRRDRVEIDFVYRWFRQELLRIEVRPQPGPVVID
jgi:hypothetical protein